MLVVIALLLGLSGFAAGQEGAPQPPRLVVRQGATTLEETYRDDRQLEAIIVGLARTGGGIIELDTGVYEFDRGLFVRDIENVHFIGRPGTVFRFRPMDEFGLIRIAKESRLADGRIHVDRPDLMRPGRRYQIFRPDLNGNRRLEFEAGTIEGDAVALAQQQNAGSEVFEAGWYVLPQLSFFDGYRCGSLTFSDIVFDGNHDVAGTAIEGNRFVGHTLHCGVLLRNPYASTATNVVPRPFVRDIRFLRCTFKNLLGRGAAIYNAGGITIRDCAFEDFGAEAIEIDHLSIDAVVAGCRILRAKLGMRLNDCTDSIVTSCTFRACDTGIQVSRVMKVNGLNRRLVIHGNVFEDCARGIALDDHCDDNVIASNVISNAEAYAIKLSGNRNTCTGNSILAPKRFGIWVTSPDSLVESNLVTRPEAAPDDWTAIRR